MADNRTPNTKRIAKNTIILYIRMLIVMGVTLFTSRIVLKALGIEDFGLYNVIGGVVGLFAFLRSSMEKCTQRFLNVEMSKEDGDLNKTFSASLSIHILIALLALLLTESIGLLFVNSKISIPEGREFAANIIYQSTIFSLITTIIIVPYSAWVIANEKMGVLAFISVLDAFLRLAIAFAISNCSSDHLVVYGLLMAGISLVNFLLYFFYCRIKYSETKFHLLYDRILYKQIFNFTGWTLAGQMAILGTNQGNNILVNMFHGVVPNAAFSIGSQVNAAVTSLTSSFQTAFNPQITKSYASKDYSYLKFLVFSTSKISYFLLFLLSIIVIVNLDFALDIWLTDVPEGAAIFCFLMLCNSILNALSSPLNFTVMASGRIKNFQIATSIAYLSDLVIVYFLFIMNYPPATALVVKVTIMIVVLFIRLFYAHKEVGVFDLKSYFSLVLWPIIASTCVSIILAFLVVYLIGLDDILYRIITTFVILLCSVGTITAMGLSNSEKQMLKKKILKRKS